MHKESLAGRTAEGFSAAAAMVGRGVLGFFREAGRAFADDFSGRSPDAMTHHMMTAGIDGPYQRDFVLGECEVQEARTRAAMGPYDEL